MKFIYNKNVYDGKIKAIPVLPEYNYKLDVDEHGNKVVVCDGVRDIQAEMDSYASEANIYNIIMRHEAGDLTALNEKPAFYPTKEIAEAAEAFVNGSLQSKMLDSFNKFNAPDLSFDKFCELISKGDYESLLKYKEKKEEVNE